MTIFLIYLLLIKPFIYKICCNSRTGDDIDMKFKSQARLDRKKYKDDQKCQIRGHAVILWLHHHFFNLGLTLRNLEAEFWIHGPMFYSSLIKTFYLIKLAEGTNKSLTQASSKSFALAEYLIFHKKSQLQRNLLGGNILKYF